MRAIRVHEHGGPEVLGVEEFPDPRPGPGEVLVRIEAVGVNFIDVYTRKGQYKAARPYTPGTEAAGTVVAVGTGVREPAVGQRVASTNFTGAYAELAIAKADRLSVLPDAVSTRVAAAVMLQGMTAQYLASSTYHLKAGDRCLVHAAAGGVGLLLCQMARQRGATVIGTVGSAEKAELARTAGAHETILYREQDFVAEVKRITNGAGVQVVYDSVGATTFAGGFDCLAPRGLMALFGQSSGPVAPFDPQLLNQKGSLFVTRPTLGHYIANTDELRWRASEVLGAVADGTLSVRIDRELPLADAALAHRALESRETSGKVLLVPAQGA